jgi:flagellar hook protein FlgE
MFTAFSTALSALAADTTAVDVVGNNLANLNTTGYKASVVSFRDLVTQSIGAGLGETQVGFGTDRPFTMRQFTQGAVQSTTGVLDAAIQGDGFFITRGNQNEQLFTRAGNFQVDGAGFLLALTGEHVQGWTENAAGQVDTNLPIGDIVVPVGTLKPPIPTKTFSVDMNLNAAAVNGAPEGTFSTTMNAIDSLGNSHALTMTFTKSTTANQWDYSITIPGADVGAAGPQQIATGSLTFDSNGTLVDPPSNTPDVAVAVTGLATGAADLNMTWQLYTSSGAPRITQYSQSSTPTANAQDGSPAASLTRVGLADGGKIVAQYSNGTQRIVGQVALASIRNPQSLIASGNNNFQASAKTALPAIGLPDSGGRGKVIGGALEYSTVDIAREFTNLIVYQRGYQVNSRVVTTADEMSQETVNLKR